jgi:hypothetical protein
MATTSTGDAGRPRASSGYSAEQLQEVRERLRTGKLTTDDTRILEELVLRTVEDVKGGTVAGRPVVASLPFGMDVIK